LRRHAGIAGRGQVHVFRGGFDGLFEKARGAVARALLGRRFFGRLGFSRRFVYSLSALGCLGGGRRLGCFRFGGLLSGCLRLSRFFGLHGFVRPGGGFAVGLRRGRLVLGRCFVLRRLLGGCYLLLGGFCILVSR